MPASFVDSNHAVAGSGQTSLTVGGVEGTEPGDVLVATMIGNIGGAAAPSGWGLLREDSATNLGMMTWTRLATTDDPQDYPFTRTQTTQHAVLIVVAYRGVLFPVNADGGQDGEGTDVTSPSVTTSTPGCRVLTIHGHWSGDAGDLSAPPGTTERATWGFLNGRRLVFADFTQPSAGVTTEQTAINSVSNAWAAQQVALSLDNVPPNAPNLTNPVGGATIDRSSTQRFVWDFDDDDPGDSQSKFDLQIRPQGSGTLSVDTSKTTTNEYYDLASGTITVGDYEWRVRTYDAQGEQGPWSGWEPFSAIEPPPGPSITDPTSGQTIPTEDYTVQWSSSEQDGYQLRRVADDGGVPDETTVYFDTGQVNSSGARSRSVNFETNNRWEHVQIRVIKDGLWSSPWVSVRVEVSYTEPAVPTVTVVEDDPSGALSVLISNPAPSGSEPDVTSNELWRRQTDDTGDGIRVAAEVARGGSFVDWAVGSGVEYAYRSRAQGDNQTTSWGAWTETPSEADGLYGGAYE